MTSCPLVQLGSVLEKVATWSPVNSPEELFAYIDLSSVNNINKRIETVSSIVGKDAPSRARQLVQARDVLVSTVRPNLNAVALVPDHLDQATASTGFSVLRPSDGIRSDYLFHWVRSKEFVDQMTRLATGASYPAVSDKIVRSSHIPLPRIEEQHRIAAILDQADAIRAKRREQLAHLSELPQVILRKVGFLSRDYENIVLSDVARLQGGRNLVALDTSSHTKFRVLKISAVTSGIFREEEAKPLPDDYLPPPSHLVQEGDLLISRANTTELVGASAYVRRVRSGIVLPDKIWRFDWLDSRSSPLFYHVLMNSPQIRRELSQMSSGSGGSMKNISKAKLERLLIPNVPFEEQQEFARKVEAIDAQRERVQRALAADEELFASLQARAFKGEL